MYFDKKKKIYRQQVTINGQRKIYSAKTKKDLMLKIAISKDEEVHKKTPLRLIADAWIEDAEKRVTSNTMKGYSAAYKKICDRWGETPAEEMTPQSIADWLKTYSNYANKTIKNILLVLRLILDYGCNNFGLQYNPALRLKAPKGRGKQEREFPDEEDIQIVRDNISHEFGLMPYMALYTGLRRGELCALQWKDIDFETNTIHVTKSVYWTNDHVPHIKSPKSKAGTRDVPLIDSLARILFPLKKKPTDYILGLPHSYQIDDGMERYRKDTGLKCTLHGLRHGYASILYSLGVDIKTASYVLGHAQTSTTMEIYTHLMEEDKISSVRDALNANTH
jgi:integrase